MAVGLLLRLAWIAWTSPLDPSHDEARFWELASIGMEGTGFIPPLYPLVLSLMQFVTGGSLTGARVAGACLATPSILLVHQLAQRHSSGTGGAVPAWIAALLPSLIYFDGRLRSESLVILLLLGFMMVWTSPTRDGRVRELAGGFLLGLVALTRPEFLILPGLLLLLEFRTEWKQILRTAAWLIPGMALAVLPWTMRNHLTLDVPALISTSGGYNFWKSFNEQTDGSQVPITDYSLWTDVPEKEVNAVGYREGLRFIREHPFRSLLLVPAKLGHTFGPERDLLSDIRRNRFPPRARSVDIAFALIQTLVLAMVLALGLVALIAPRGSTVKTVILAIVFNLIIVHMVFFGDDRFHLPLLPCLCIIMPDAWDGSRPSPGRARLVLAALAFEGLFWIGILCRDFESLMMLGIR